MLEKRIIPVLLLDEEKLVKGNNFSNHIYIGDPINTVHLFNEKEANEIIILDIGKRKKNYEIQYELLKKISSEAFLPLTYGGGIDSEDEAMRVIDMGFEKIVLNSGVLNNPKLLNSISKIIGSQSVVISVDVRLIKNKYYVFSNNGSTNTHILIEDHLKEIQENGAGEVMVTSINQEGSMNGYDKNLIDISLKKLKIPLIINGGAKDYNEFKNIFLNYDISACAASSIFLFIGNLKGVLISYPTKNDLKFIFE